MSIQDRKQDHLKIALKQGSPAHNAFDELYFEHNALPEVDFAEINTKLDLFGKKVSAPIIISSMTGGMKEGRQINETLAYLAEKYSIPMGLGSQRIMLEDETQQSTFDIRKIAPNIVLLANIGAVQLNYGVTLEDCKRIVDFVQADALCLHLNPLQEAIQPEGDTNFKGLLNKIANVVKHVGVPVIIKEVGAGISFSVAKKLTEIGVQYIDVAGVGGTSWAGIEGERRPGVDLLGALYADWGITTPEAIKQCKKIDGLTVIAGGGIRSGLDIAKSIALGATFASVGYPFLKAALEGKEAACNFMESLLNDLKVAMFATGSGNLQALHEQTLHRKN